MTRRKISTVSGAEGRLAEAIAMRAVLAAALDAPDTPARELPPLVRRMTELAELIEHLEAREAEQRRDAERRDEGDAPFRLEAI